MSESKFPEYLLAENQAVTGENIGLFHAAERGNLAEVRRLLSKGAKPNFFHRPEDQKNALHVAAERDFVEVADALLRAGAAVDAVAATDQATALTYAARSASAAMITLLLDAGADIRHGKSML